MVTRRQRRSPLDLTERQMQNCLVLVGVALIIYMIVTRFPLDPIYAGLISALLFGQKLIPWGSRDTGSDTSNDKTVGVADHRTQSPQLPRNNDNDVGINRRNMRLRYPS
jgi:hypothetical protein